MAHNILGIDYGDRRIGLAVAKGLEAPRRLVTLINNEEVLADLERLVAEQAIEAVVIGLPRNLDGDDTPQTDRVRRFGARLQADLGQIALSWQDEALTSEVARNRLRQEGVRDPEVLVDQEAAVIILEDFLRGT